MIEILPTDAQWRGSPDAGAPGCWCSRCLGWIRAGQVPMRVYRKGGEYRYCESCTTSATATPSLFRNAK